MADREQLTREEKTLIKDIFGETNGYLKQYILSVVYPCADEATVEALVRKMSTIYMKLKRELRED